MVAFVNFSKVHSFQKYDKPPPILRIDKVISEAGIYGQNSESTGKEEGNC